jgi:hypothetical protein
LNRLEKETSQVAKYVIKKNLRNVLKKIFVQKQIDGLISDKKKIRLECENYVYSQNIKHRESKSLSRFEEKSVSISSFI